MIYASWIEICMIWVLTYPMASLARFSSLSEPLDQDPSWKKSVSPIGKIHGFKPIAIDTTPSPTIHCIKFPQFSNPSWRWSTTLMIKHKTILGWAVPSWDNLKLDALAPVWSSYSSLTLDRTIWEAGFLHLKTNRPMKKNITRDPGDPQHKPICQKNFQRFS